MVKKIIAFLAIFAIILVPSSFCLAADYVSENSLGSIYDNNLPGWLSWFMKGLTGDGDICDKSPDTHHHASSSVSRDSGGNYVCVCSYCGDSFITSLAQVKAAEATAVSALPATTYASDGSIIWKPTWSDLSGERTSLYSWVSGSGFVLDAPVAFGAKYSDPKNADLVYTVVSPRSYSGHYASVDKLKIRSIKYGDFGFFAPITGIYTVLGEGYPGLSYVGRNDTVEYSDTLYYSKPSFFAAQGNTFFISAPQVIGFDTYCTYFQAAYYLPTFRVVPDTSVADAPDYTTIYDNSTRVGNYVGSYAVYNSTDNSYNPVSGDTHIVNETNNSVYNPVTNTTTDYSGWTYDYSTRTYTFSNDDNSSTSTVTYGDENITIADTVIDGNGNTVTSNYTVYYYNGIAIDAPSPSPGPFPSAGPSTPVNPSGGSRVFQNYPATITQSYGNDGHGGTDCIPTSGAADTVVAHSDGQVVWVQTGQDNNQGSTGDASYGNAVKLQHANGYYTLYAHLDSVAVAEGQQVTKGQALGVMGNTGNSYGAHLHFEVRNDTDTRVNSDPYLYADLPGLSTNSSWWGNAMGSLGNVLGASGLLEIFGSVGSAFSQLWSWLPPEIVMVFLVGVTLLVAAACMKFFL